MGIPKTGKKSTAKKPPKPPVGGKRAPSTAEAEDQDDLAPRGRGRPRLPANDKLRDAKLQKELLEIHIREIELARLRGQVLSVDIHRQAIAGAFSRVAAKLNGLEQRIAMAVTGATLQERVTQASALVLELKRDLAAARDVPMATPASAPRATLRRRRANG